MQRYVLQSMKHYFWLGLVVLLLVAAKCGSTANLPAAVYGKTWLHSYEEDSAEVRSYRPNTFDFPPSRGRTGFSLLENGTFVRYGIAPTDGLEEQPGRWKAHGKNEIQVQYDNPSNAPETLEIISVTEDKITLRVKKDLL
ncbi:hypothetical protein GCM10027189_07680 [Rufibacter soli]